jgi:hypothetical protein
VLWQLPGWQNRTQYFTEGEGARLSIIVRADAARGCKEHGRRKQALLVAELHLAQLQ